MDHETESRIRFDIAGMARGVVRDYQDAPHTSGKLVRIRLDTLAYAWLRREAGQSLWSVDAADLKPGLCRLTGAIHALAAEKGIIGRLDKDTLRDVERVLASRSTSAAGSLLAAVATLRELIAHELKHRHGFDATQRRPFAMKLETHDGAVA